VILAIDQSTSATKGLVYDLKGQLIDKTSLDHQQIYPRPGWVEHDAEEIWQNSLKVLQTLARKHQNLTCLSITNQRETIVVFERGTGRPLHHALVWQDRRGDEICQELVGRGFEPLVTQKTGLKIDTYFSASKLSWLIRNQPDLAFKLSSGEALIGTIDSYLIYRLTNGTVHATDHTNASRMLLLDINTLQWDEQLCKAFAVPMRALPQPRDSTATFGETNLDGVLSKAIPICGVMGDSQASLFAHRCFSPGMAKATLGTGCSVLLNLGETLRLSPGAAVSTVAWTHAGKATYSFEGIINCAASTIAWLKRDLQLISDERETEAIAQSIPDNAGVYLVPAFAGLGAPHWQAQARAAIVGMTTATKKAHIVRAALESIAYQIRDVLDAMQQGAGVALQSIHCDGGATRNKFLMQFIADITGLKIRVAEMPDCSSLGATLAGMVGMKLSSFDDLRSLSREQVIYHPMMTPGDVEKLHRKWHRAVKQVLAGLD
jgi:glycerol kinase